jgi:hypothetical protein
MGEPELLQIGAETPRVQSRRFLVVLLALVVGLAVAGALVDHSYRVREERAVEGCAREVGTAVDLSGRPIHAAYEYIRPVLANGPGSAREKALYLLVAKEARDVYAPLAAAGWTCQDVTVLPWHDSLLQRRDRCIAVLARQGAGLEAVARDGESVLAWMELPRTC